MIIRKNGETNQQWAQRCEVYANNIAENNRVLRIQNEQLAQVSETTNPRTMQKYPDEAKQMFITIAYINLAIRNGDFEMARAMSQEQLELLGFNLVQIYQNECLKDNAYNGKG